MFQQLKEKISDKLWSLGSDDLDRSVNDLVSRGTSETLIAPDWSINMALVDMVNQNPTVMPEKLLKVLKRTMMKPNAKTQILTLTILETCIKNCTTLLYSALSTSELWLELVKMTADTSISRVDAEVRDKILCMVEDYAKVLPQKEFRETYEYLLEHGVDFPVRSPDDQPPILTPPSAYQPPPLVVAGSPGAVVPEAGAAAVAAQPAEDPFSGMSPEDRAAIQAAMAEMEEEERVVRESAALAASTALLQHVGSQPASDGHSVPPREPVQQQQADADTPLPENTEETLQVISNATGLLNEMLASETDPREPYVVELAEECVRMQSKLEQIINTLTDEDQLASALVHHEALQGAITKYNEHLTKANQGTGMASPAAGLQARPLQQLPGDLMLGDVASAGAAPPPSPFLPHVAGSAGPNFSLLGDDEEGQDSEELLSSKRTGAADAAVDAPAALPGTAAPAPPGNLIDLDPVQTAPPQQEQLDSLMQGLTVQAAPETDPVEQLHDTAGTKV